MGRSASAHRHRGNKRLTCVQVGQVWVLNVGVMILQVVAELHGRVGAEGALGTVVHLDALVLPRVEDVLADVLRTVGSEGGGRRKGACLPRNDIWNVHFECEERNVTKTRRRCFQDTFDQESEKNDVTHSQIFPFSRLIWI